MKTKKIVFAGMGLLIAIFGTFSFRDKNFHPGGSYFTLDTSVTPNKCNTITCTTTNYAGTERCILTGTDIYTNSSCTTLEDRPLYITDAL
jgi:hypothetical protein